jgi:hypothetical protein
MWKTVSSSNPHTKQTGSSARPNPWRCFLKLPWHVITETKFRSVALLSLNRYLVTVNCGPTVLYLWTIISKHSSLELNRNLIEIYFKSPIATKASEIQFVVWAKCLLQVLSPIIPSWDCSQGLCSWDDKRVQINQLKFNWNVFIP